MADRPGSFRQTPRVSRHTMVMRKAMEDDVQRLPDSEHDLQRTAASNRMQAPAAAPAAAEQPGDRVGDSVVAGRRVGARTVVIHRDGASASSRRLSVTSTRLSGRQAASVRVTGGDTIIRYQSGDMVIKRGARRLRLRRQLLWAYALGYLLLFGAFGWFLLTGATEISPDDFVARAFFLRHGTGVPDLEKAAFEAMRGNRTPAEVRLAETLTFHDGDKELIRVEAGSRMTLLTAAKLGRAIILDQAREPSRRTFTRPLKLYKETYLATLDWPHWLTLYNALGFFLMTVLFLWRPLLSFLGTEGKKTAVGLRNARDAQAEAAAYRDKYRELAGDVEAREERMKAELEKTAAAEREAALEDARRQAGSIAGGMSDALGREAGSLSVRLGERIAAEACDRARRILEQRLGQKEHDAAIDELIAGIAGARLPEA